MFKKRAFAGARGAEDGKHFATTDLKVNPFEDRAVAVANRQIVGFNHRACNAIHFLRV
jgi:hypothetical protein